MTPKKLSLPAEVARLEDRVIRDALRYNKGIMRRTATYLGISRAGLYKKMSRLNINAKDFR